MGFLAFRNGRVQFSRVRLATIASTPAIPEGFFVIELGIQRSLRHSCCGQNDAQVSASKSGAVYPATITLVCAPDRAAQRRCISACFWPATDMHVKTAFSKANVLPVFRFRSQVPTSGLPNFGALTAMSTDIRMN